MGVIHFTTFLAFVSIFVNGVPLVSLPMFMTREEAVFVTEGDTARLPCAVRFLGTHKVTWRKRGEDILSVGKYILTKDSSITLETEDLAQEVTEWNLIIANTTQNHQGVYQCQFSTSEESTRNVTLNVVNKRLKTLPDIKITGKNVVDQGQSIHFVCVINGVGTRSLPGQLDVDWYVNGNKIDFSTNRRVYRTNSFVNNQMVNELYINSSRASDSGTYVCRTKTVADSTRVLVRLRDDGHPDCTMENLNKCVGPQGKDNTDLAQVCRAMSAARSCLRKIYHDCSQSLKSRIDKMTNRFQKAEWICTIL